MARRGEHDRGKERFWRRVLRQWRRSGQGVRDFCAAEQLSESSFYVWRRTIAVRDQEAHPRQSPRKPGKAPVFVPVRVVATPPALEVVLRNGRVVRVPAGFDAAALRQLLGVFDEAPPC